MEVGPWAMEKLECLRKYLHAYTTIMSQTTIRGDTSISMHLQAREISKYVENRTARNNHFLTHW